MLCLCWCHIHTHTMYIFCIQTFLYTYTYIHIYIYMYMYTKNVCRIRQKKPTVYICCTSRNEVPAHIAVDTYNFSSTHIQTELVYSRGRTYSHSRTLVVCIYVATVDPLGSCSPLVAVCMQNTPKEAYSLYCTSRSEVAGGAPPRRYLGCTEP